MSEEEAANPTSYPLPEYGYRKPLKLLTKDLRFAAVEAIRAAPAPLPPDPTKPAHYNDTTITPFQVIDDWKLDFYLGNVVKYVCRREKKGNELADLKKAATYLARKIQQLENE
jgi:hypothetical protein